MHRIILSGTRSLWPSCLPSLLLLLFHILHNPVSNKMPVYEILPAAACRTAVAQPHSLDFVGLVKWRSFCPGTLFRGGLGKEGLMLIFPVSVQAVFPVSVQELESPCC